MIAMAIDHWKAMYLGQKSFSEMLEKQVDVINEYWSKENLKLKDTETSKYFPKNIFIDSIHTFFKYKVMDKEIETKSFSNILLPYTCTLTIYGISGITPGNRFAVDYLPARYRERTYFVCTKVSHDVTNQGWKTTIVGDMRLYLKISQPFLSPIYQESHRIAPRRLRIV